MEDKQQQAKNVLAEYLKEAVAYLRYSSHLQDKGVSIEYQIAEVEEYAKRNGYVIKEWYIDRAITAKEVAGRDEFVRLFKDIEAGTTPDTLIVWGTNRAFRNSIESAIYRERLRKKGVKLLSATQQIDDDTTSGRFMIDIIARVDQYKIEEIGEHVSAAMRLLINEGFHASGRPPYGYDIVPVMHNGKERQKLVPNKKEAEVVRSIFDQFCEEGNLRRIYTRLAEQGIRNKQGKPYARDSIRWMLKNLVYKGARLYKMKNGADVYNENYCEPIVSPEQFDEAQKILEGNRKATQGRKRKNVYPLTGKLFCLKCGTPLTGIVTKQKYGYYSCRGKQNFMDCDTRLVRRDWLEPLIFETILKNILSDKAIANITQQALKQIKKAPAEAEDEKSLTKKKEKLQSDITEIVQMKLNGDISADIMTMMKKSKEDELSAINRKLSEISVAFNSNIDEAYIKRQIKSIFDPTQDYADPEILFALFAQTVEKVEISNTQVIIYLRVPILNRLDKVEFKSLHFTLNIQIDR